MSSSERTAGLRFEVRDASGDGRTITGLLVPYGVESDGAPTREQFEPASFKRSISHIGRSKTPFKLFRAHNLAAPVGTANRLEDTAEGPLAEFRLADTKAGNEMRLEVAEKVMDAISVGFTALRERAVSGVRHILEARLHEASLVAIGAYPGARVLSVRSASAAMPDLPSRPVVATPRSVILNGTRWTV